MNQSVEGVIERGKGRGKLLGFPTINIVSTEIPEAGIYASRVSIKGKAYHAAAFVDPKRGIVEAHILDFNADVYGETGTIELCKKIRDSIEASEEELIQAITEDVRIVREYFEKHP